MSRPTTIKMTYYLHFLLLTLHIYVYSVSAVNFDVNKVINIKVNDKDRVEGSYFGYSLLLQKGKHPIIIVGAPKQSAQTGGSIFSCDIFSNNGCIKYATNIRSNGTFNGNFLGSVIDGEDEIGKKFVACAPRKVTEGNGETSLNYYLKGACLLYTNSSFTSTTGFLLNPLKDEKPLGRVSKEYYYDNAFGQAGIDISFKKGESTCIMGATGIKNWDGGIVIQSLQYLTQYSILPKKDKPNTAEGYDYLGYKVGYGNVGKTQMLYAGAPRAKHLFGKVKLYNNNRENRSFTGEELGAYFGSAILAQDVNNDGSDDLFIGAPTTAGSSYDEGCVYFYKNALGSAVKLVGVGKQGSRFGTNIVALGDIDLDGFNDVAIAAPFEDGVGVVYIFMGRSDGITNTYSQRLTPTAFPGINFPVKGFGVGLSKGNDIDANGHNDIAIGAFKSGHVFLVPTKYVIDFRTMLEPLNITSIGSADNEITLRFCISYKPRSKLSKITSTNFRMKLNMDYRVKGPKVHVEDVKVLPKVKLCKEKPIKIEQSAIVPFIFSLETQVLDDVHGEGTRVLEKTIPYSHGCGNDNICQTRVLLDISPNTQEIIVGLTKTITAKIFAENFGEPGYQCQLLLDVPNEIQLTNKSRCTYENSTYTCPFAAKLFNFTEKEVIFDVSSIQPTIESINVTFKVTCLGDNIDNKEHLMLFVTMLNSPYIEGKSEPENFENNDLDNTDVELRHTFTVGNFGPSPVKTDVYILVPQKQFANIEIFQFIEAKQILRGIELPCYPTSGSKSDERNYDLASVVKSTPNGTIFFDCYEEGFTCMELFCEGDYLYKTTEIAKYTLKVKTNTKLLAEFFKNQLENKYILAYISSAFLNNGTRIQTTAITLLLSSHTTYIPLWVYIVASVIGILLMGLIIFICYKCHFFDRRFKEKMDSERLMDQNIEIEGQEPTIQLEDSEEEKS